ncbi:MAG: hypothetical protein E7530_02955 [Ruminococcaceae bacterium]|nr:hypothetical protein [Oscillospiraceae bacterium]
MKKLLKNSLSVLLAITIIFSSAIVGLGEVDLSSLFVVEAKASSSGTCGDNLTWSLDDYGTLTVSGEGDMYENIDDLYKPWESVINKIKNLVIDDGVTSIGMFNFNGCKSLTTITIPNSVTNIGFCAFENCVSLTAVNIPDSVKNIGSHAFYNTAMYNNPDCWDGEVLYIDNHLISAKGSLSGSYTVKPGIKTIADRVFYGCTNLTLITMPDSVTSIGDYAFYNCENLISITIPDSVTSIGDYAFYNTGYYNDNSNWDNGVLYIGGHLIDAKTSINGDYEIKVGTNTIHAYAFKNCTNLTSITIPDSVKNIGSSAFENCSSLTTVTIPNSVISIGDSAFYDCNNLLHIFYSGNSEDWENLAIDSGNNNLIWANVYYGYIFGDYDGNYILGIKANGEAAFLGYETEFNGIPSECLGYPVTTIATGAFSGKGISSISIPYSITTICYGAFDNNRYLKNIFYPGTKEDWSKIKIDDKNSSLHSAIKYYGCISGASSYPFIWGININGEAEVLGCTVPNSTLFGVKQISIPSEYSGYPVTKIGERAFEDCDYLEEVIIPDSVTSIGDAAFYDCYSLTSVTVPDSVTNIGSFTFAYCYSLTTITIPNSITNIGSYAFCDCRNLESITIPDSVTSIGDAAFNGCDSLTSITIPNSVTSLGVGAFGDCDWLEKIILQCDSNVREEASCYYNLKLTHGSLSDWVIVKNATANAVGKKQKVCTKCGDVIETATIPQLKPATPKLTKVANTVSGAQVTWGKVTGADSYIVYRRTYNAKTKAWGSWGRVASGVTSTSYVDKTVKSGTYYRYTVKAVNESGASGYNTSGIKTYFLSTPKVTSTANTNSGITIKWGKVSGATGYIVYRKTGNGKWTNLGKTTGISFTDKKATAGVTYRYTVKAYYGSYVSSYNSNGYAVRRLTTPKLSSATSNNEGVLLKWNKVTGATGYIVYRKASSGEWKAIATIKGNTKIKYLDETPRKGATYQYCVKAYYGTSKSTSSNTIKLKCKY